MTSHANAAAWGLRYSRLLSLILMVLVLKTSIGCAQNLERQPDSVLTQDRIAIEAIQASAEIPLEKVLRISDQLISGGEPKSPQAFAALEKLGVKTIISVDGATPRVEEARARGIRYVHIPIGYDGIEKGEVDLLLAASRQCDGPIYVHCHHGQHRAPAAATILAKGLGLRFLRPDQTDILTAALTGVQYPGLWECATRAVTLPPSGSTVDLPEVVRPDSDVEAMTRMDRTFENLVGLSANGWAPLPTHPDITSPHEALLLWEQIVEWKRLDQESRSADFQKMTDEMLTLSTRLKDALARSEFTESHRHLTGLKASCSACHKSYRN